MLEYVIISMYSCQYLVDFIVLRIKAKLNIYPLILGGPLAIVYIYSSYRAMNMATTHHG